MSWMSDQVYIMGRCAECEESDFCQSRGWGCGSTSDSIQDAFDEAADYAYEDDV